MLLFCHKAIYYILEGLIGMQIKITNKISEKVEELQVTTGITKKWVAAQMGMSQQRLYYLFKADNMMLDMALKFSIFLNCDIKDIFEYEVIK